MKLMQKKKMDLKLLLIIGFIVMCSVSFTVAQDEEYPEYAEYPEYTEYPEYVGEPEPEPMPGVCAVLVGTSLSLSTPCRFDSVDALATFNKKNYCQDYKQMQCKAGQLISSLCPNRCACVKPPKIEGLPQCRLYKPPRIQDLSQCRRY